MAPPKQEQCPFCGRVAPVVFRGSESLCSACGRSRLSLNALPMNVAGKPSKVGGRVARAIGLAVLAFGLIVSTALAAFFQAIFPNGLVGWVIGIPIAVLSLVVGIFLVRGGKKLQSLGEEAERGAREKALFAFAAHKNGKVTAREAAQALNISEADADASLTQLAKDRYGEISLDVDDDGNLLYSFERTNEGTKARIGDPQDLMDEFDPGAPEQRRTRGP